MHFIVQLLNQVSRNMSITWVIIECMLDSTFVSEVLEDIFRKWNIRDETIIVKSDNAPTQYKSKNAFFMCRA